MDDSNKNNLDVSFLFIAITKESYIQPTKATACANISQSRVGFVLKNPVLVAILVISLLLNAAGIVFFILFLTEHGHYKSARKEKALLERNLAVVQSAGVINQINQGNSSDPVQKRSFVSRLDGQVDTNAFQPPQFTPGALDYVLVVYLHGMGSNQMEPFVTPAGQSMASAMTRDNPRVGVLSLNYRHEASWGNDTATEDIVQNIREAMQEYPFKSIVMMGTSMGACVSLNFAATAPEDIRSKIIGAICIEGAGDLTSLFNRTSVEAVKQAMMIAYGGAPDQVGHVYQRKSFQSNIAGLPHGARVYVLSAKGDRVVPPELQKDIVDHLSKAGIQNHFDEVEGGHEAPPAQYYTRAISYVLGQNL